MEVSSRITTVFPWVVLVLQLGSHQLYIESDTFLYLLYLLCCMFLFDHDCDYVLNNYDLHMSNIASQKKIGKKTWSSSWKWTIDVTIVHFKNSSWLKCLLFSLWFRIFNHYTRFSILIFHKFGTCNMFNVVLSINFQVESGPTRKGDSFTLCKTREQIQ